MAYQTQSKKNGKTYFLHQKGKLFYFAAAAGANAVDLPTGYEVGENTRTGLPVLRKIK